MHNLIQSLVEGHLCGAQQQELIILNYITYVVKVINFIAFLCPIEPASGLARMQGTFQGQRAVIPRARTIQTNAYIGN